MGGCLKRWKEVGLAGGGGAGRSVLIHARLRNEPSSGISTFSVCAGLIMKERGGSRGRVREMEMCFVGQFMIPRMCVCH